MTTYKFITETEQDTAVPIRLELGTPDADGNIQLRAFDGSDKQVVAIIRPGKGIRLCHLFSANIRAAFGCGDHDKAHIIND